MEESAIQAFRGQHPRCPVAEKVAKVVSTASSRSASGFVEFKTSETSTQWQCPAFLNGVVKECRKGGGSSSSGGSSTCRRFGDPAIPWNGHLLPQAPQPTSPDPEALNSF